MMETLTLSMQPRISFKSVNCIAWHLLRQAPRVTRFLIWQLYNACKISRFGVHTLFLFSVAHQGKQFRGQGCNAVVQAHVDPHTNTGNNPIATAYTYGGTRRAQVMFGVTSLLCDLPSMNPCRFSTHFAYFLIAGSPAKIILIRRS